MTEYKSKIPQDFYEEINIESSKGEKKKVNKGIKNLFTKIRI